MRQELLAWILFRQVGIYSSAGQNYEPEDADKVMYKESKEGVMLEEGITAALFLHGLL